MKLAISNKKQRDTTESENHAASLYRNCGCSPYDDRGLSAMRCRFIRSSQYVRRIYDHRIKDFLSEGKGNKEQMKFYTYGDKCNPLIVMLPGSFCPAKVLQYLYSKLQLDFYVCVPEYNGHYAGSTFTSRQNEAREVVQYLLKENLTEINMIYGQSMGAEIGIELMHQLLQKGIHVGRAFFDGAPCIRFSKPYKAFMNMKFRKLIHMIRDKSADDVLQWKFLNAFTNGDTESLRPLIEDLIDVAPYLTDESIKAETECCYTFDFPSFCNEDQKKLFFFYAKEEKAYKICYKGLVQAYPNAVFKVVSGYGHMTYSVRHTNEYVQLLRDACV